MAKITKHNENVNIDGSLSVGLDNAAAKFHVQGSGNTSSSYTAIFQNLSGGTILQVRDDRKIRYTDNSEGAGKVLTSDTNGVATWIAFTGGTNSSYATTFTPGTINVPNTITHGLGTTDLSVTTVDLSTGEIFLATKIDNITVNTLAVTFSVNPAGNVRAIVLAAGGTGSTGSTTTVFTGVTVNGNLNVTGTTTSGTISATTYLNLPLDIRVTGGTPNNTSNLYVFTNNTGGTFNVNGLTDVRVTGGTYSAGTTVFTNNTGGTFSVTGFTTGGINKFSTTLITPTGNTINTITHNLGTTDISVSLWLVTTGDLTSATITNRTTNSVGVVFSSSPGENVRVVIIG